MRKTFRYIGSWLHWLLAKLAEMFFRVVTFAALSVIMVLVCIYIIDYAYEKGQQPCAPSYRYQAFIEKKLWHEGEKDDRLYLIRMELTDAETGYLNTFRAWVTPEQYELMKDPDYSLTLSEIHRNGWAIPDWGLTIEEF